MQSRHFWKLHKLWGFLLILCPLLSDCFLNEVYFSPHRPSTRARDFSQCGASESTACSCEDFSTLSRRLCSLCRGRSTLAVRFLPGECRIPIGSAQTTWPKSGRGRLQSPFVFVEENCNCQQLLIKGDETNRTLLLPVEQTDEARRKTESSRWKSEPPFPHLRDSWALFVFALPLVEVSHMSFESHFDSDHSYLYVTSCRLFVVRHCHFLGLGSRTGGILALSNGYNRPGKLRILNSEFVSNSRPGVRRKLFATGIMMWFGFSAEIEGCTFWLLCGFESSGGNSSSETDKVGRRPTSGHAM